MWLRIIQIVFLVALTAPAHADYLTELQQTAGTLQLAENPVWRNLLHYKRHPLTGRLRSLADDPSFFNAKEGKTDAQAELDATLAAFFSDESETATSQNPQCRFLARFAWLDEQLHFDERLLRQACPRFKEWHEAMNPAGLTLVFPAAYLNSPASMYGHTMFRIDAIGQTDATRLLAYTVSYAANGDAGDGMMFALKGLLGLYSGQFASVPYYLKVREYNDIENRDVWEYELNLTLQEVERILMHVWELGPTKFDYYFFDENCAYHLLSLLDVARPSLQLTDQFVWTAIPSDTVRATVKTAGILKRVTYRPSNVTDIEFRFARARADLRATAKAMARGTATLDTTTLTAISPAERGQTLELANQYLTLLEHKGEVTEAVAAGRSRQLMLARSKQPTTEPLLIDMPTVRPDQGHKSTRLHLAAGVENGRAIGEVRYRAAYHDLLDAEPGFNRGAQLQFFDLTVRQSAGQGWRLQSLVPVDIVSLTPRTELSHERSWKIQFGLQQHRSPIGRPDRLVAQINGGPGLAWNLQPTTLAYLFMENRAVAGSALDQGFALGTGASAGLLHDISAHWRLQAATSLVRYWAGERQTVRQYELHQRWTTGRNQAIRLELKNERDGGSSRTTTLLGWSAYF